MKAGAVYKYTLHDLRTGGHVVVPDFTTTKVPTVTNSDYMSSL